MEVYHPANGIVVAGLYPKVGTLHGASGNFIAGEKLIFRKLPDAPWSVPTKYMGAPALFQIHHPADGIVVAIDVITASEGTRRQRETEAVRRLLNELMPGAVLAHRADGVPYLTGADATWISVSHSRRHVAIALSIVGPVGIDIEEPARLDQLAHVMPRVANPADRGTDPAALWTAKEAAYKCLSDSSLNLPAIPVNLAASTAGTCKLTFITHPILYIAIASTH